MKVVRHPSSCMKNMVIWGIQGEYTIQFFGDYMDNMAIIYGDYMGQQRFYWGLYYSVYLDYMGVMWDYMGLYGIVINHYKFPF